jgi:hypothetical protein
MYTVKNFKTKKALKEAVASGVQVETYQPGGMFEAKRDGNISLEGPHYPAPHSWYASATIKDGVIIAGSVK